jgi:hypothetical protein
MARLFAGAGWSVKRRLPFRRIPGYVRRMNEPRGSERVQRVRIGLTGLAFVFLLVLLGTAISRSGDPPAESNDAAGQAEAAAPDEPLAQIGVAPGQSTTENTATNAQPAR